MRRDTGTLLAVFLMLAASHVCGAEGKKQPGAWGKPVAGLRAGLAVVESAKELHRPPAFRITLENTGEADLVLNLGHMLNNGRKHYLSAVALVLTHPDGKIRRLKLAGGGRVAGRIDDLILPLAAGASFSFRVRLDRYWCPDRSEFKIEFPPGEYGIVAVFNGGSARHQTGTAAIPDLPFWRGRAISARLTFSIAGKDADGK